MAETLKSDIEMVHRAEGSQLPPPAGVSRIALSSSKVIVDTPSGRRKVDFSVVPTERSLYGTEEDARLDDMYLQIEVVQNFLRRIFRRSSPAPSDLDIGMVHPDLGEAASPRLVVKQQDRIPLGDANYAFMGDGQRMTVDGERPLVDEFVGRHADKFPLAA